MWYLWEHINIAFGTWYSLIELVNVLFSIPIKKGLQKLFTFTWQGQQHTFPCVHLTNLLPLELDKRLLRE